MESDKVETRVFRKSVGWVVFRSTDDVKQSVTDFLESSKTVHGFKKIKANAVLKVAVTL